MLITNSPHIQQKLLQKFLQSRLAIHGAHEQKAEKWGYADWKEQL